MNFIGRCSVIAHVTARCTTNYQKVGGCGCLYLLCCCYRDSWQPW